MNKYEDLEKLYKLKESGTLTEEEFSIEKKNILDNMGDFSGVYENKTDNQNAKSKINNVIAFIGIIILIVLVIVILLKPEKVQVPNLVGKTVEEARQIIEDLNLKLSISGSSYYKNVIANQNHLEGEIVTEGTLISITTENIENEEQTKKSNTNNNLNKKSQTLKVKYSQIVNGMPDYEVHTILGPPYDVENDVYSTTTWKDENSVVFVKFYNNVVIAKSITQLK